MKNNASVITNRWQYCWIRNDKQTNNMQLCHVTWHLFFHFSGQEIAVRKKLVAVHEMETCSEYLSVCRYTMIEVLTAKGVDWNSPPRINCLWWWLDLGSPTGKLLLDTVQIFNDNIKMKFELNQCAKPSIKMEYLLHMGLNFTMALKSKHWHCLREFGMF